MVEMLANINNTEELNVKAERMESNKQHHNRIMIEHAKGCAESKNVDLTKTLLYSVLISSFSW